MATTRSRSATRVSTRSSSKERKAASRVPSKTSAAARSTLFQKLGAAIVLTMLQCSLALFASSSMRNNKYEYNFAIIPGLAEAFKLVVSCCLFWREAISAGSQTNRRPKVTLSKTYLYALPSLLFLAVNNLPFLMMQYFDPASYQVLSNLKIVTTAILFSILLRKRLRPMQWIAIILLFAGVTMTQLKNTCDKSAYQFQAPLKAYIIAILAATFSGFAAIYMEWLMKRTNDSIHWQNIQLYAVGVIFNAVSAFNNSDKGLSLAGFNLFSWLTVLNLSLSGLIISWITKYADSMVKVYAKSVSIPLTAIITALISHSMLPMNVILGIIVTSCSVLVYYLPN